MAIDVQRFDIFIEGMTNYFEFVEGNSANFAKNMQLGTPYLLSPNEPVGMGYNGMIRISGDFKGCVLFCADDIFLNALLPVLGEDDKSVEMLLDTVGEIANMISGSAKEELGGRYFVSVPFLSERPLNPELFANHDKLYVLPFFWRDREAKLIMGFSTRHH